MFPARIVEAVDVFEEGDLDLATGLPVAAPDEFSLQGYLRGGVNNYLISKPRDSTT